MRRYANVSYLCIFVINIHIYFVYVQATATAKFIEDANKLYDKNMSLYIHGRYHMPHRCWCFTPEEARINPDAAAVTRMTEIIYERVDYLKDKDCPFTIEQLRDSNGVYFDWNDVFGEV